MVETDMSWMLGQKVLELSGGLMSTQNAKTAKEALQEPNMLCPNMLC